jgi:hypothetical protein
MASLIAGVASGVGTFVRSRSGNNNEGLSIVAPLGAVLLLYGWLILGFVWAVRLHESIDVQGWSGWPMWTSLVFLLIAVVTGHVVNVNLISFHRYYRDG